MQTFATPRPSLAIHGGPRAVTAEAPQNQLLGPNEFGDEEIAAVTEVLQSRSVFRFGMDQADSRVARFEKLFAEKSGAGHVLAVNSGTSALIAGLIGIGVAPGDEVLVPAYTYIATPAAVLALGAYPVIVETDASLTIDPADIERKITERTRAIIPVHMRGMPCDMRRIMDIADRHRLAVLEDCAQANGGTFAGRSLGTWGHAGVFSFQQSKILSCGEGGVLITNDRNVFERAAMYHDSAWTFWTHRNHLTEEQKAAWNRIAFLGENYRQSEIHGAIALEQLKKRDRILARTRAIKHQLAAACASIPGAGQEVCHDPEGDCGISLVFFMPDGARAQSTAAALEAEGVPCGTIFSKSFPDRHIFCHWHYILGKHSPHRTGFPWTSPGMQCSVEYSRDMCPATLGWLERAVVIAITQTMTDEYVGQLCAAIRKVAGASGAGGPA